MKNKSISLEKSFCVPFNGDKNLVKRITGEYAEYVHEFYGNDNRFSSGRYKSFSNPKSFEDDIKIMRSNGIRFNYLLNSIVIDDYLLKIDELKKHLQYLNDIGVSSITLSSPYFIDMVKDYDFEISTSLMQKIDSENSLYFHQQLGYDRIIVSEDSLRNVKMIKSFRKMTNKPMEVIISNCCLMGCPFRTTHYSILNNRNKKISNQLRFHATHYCEQCVKFWRIDASQFLKTSWIRPEELHCYKLMGVDYFKMPGRTFSTEAIIDSLAIYVQGMWDGSIFSYLLPGKSPEEVFGIYDISNRELDKFFEYIMIHGCDGVCSTCGLCSKWAKVIRCVEEPPRYFPLNNGALNFLEYSKKLLSNSDE